MKKFWKVLGVTAAIAALAPYRVGRDEETGEKTVEALLWRATAAPRDGEEETSVAVSFGFRSPFAQRSGEPLFEEEPAAEFTVPAEEETADGETVDEEEAPAPHGEEAGGSEPRPEEPAEGGTQAPPQE